MEHRRASAIAIACVLCVVLALGGQALTDASAAELGRADAGELIGGASSSYLTGVKRFAAAALWNRMDPILHNYYEGVGFDDQLYILPTVAMVQTLDPQLVQPYYIGAWMLVRNDRPEDGVAMAERGVRENPDAGILYVNLAQLQHLYADDLPAAVKTGEQVLEHEMWWTDFTEKYNAYPALRAIFAKAGRDDLVDAVNEELEYLDQEARDRLGSDPEAPEHDHDGDGVADH
ncbi:MAG: hypothetical protein ACYC2X_00985 [Coriobacteriia bacterium]